MMYVEVGQRYIFKSADASFVGEVVAITGEFHSVKIIQIINWSYEKVGHIYGRCHVDQDSWSLLKGQEKPKS